MLRERQRSPTGQREGEERGGGGQVDHIFRAYINLILMSLKALQYYWLAAVGGHKEAQYRHAKLLLTNREHQSLDNLNTAISLLEQAAAAGLTKVGDHGCADILLVKLLNTSYNRTYQDVGL